MFDHDPELPTGFQDADLEMAALVAQANREARLRKRGLCPHSWIGPVVIGQPERQCYHCGKLFAKESDIWAERKERLA